MMGHSDLMFDDRQPPATLQPDVCSPDCIPPCLPDTYAVSGGDVELSSWVGHGTPRTMHRRCAPSRAETDRGSARRSSLPPRASRRNPQIRWKRQRLFPSAPTRSRDNGGLGGQGCGLPHDQAGFATKTGAAKVLCPVDWKTISFKKAWSLSGRSRRCTIMTRCPIEKSWEEVRSACTGTQLNAVIEHALTTTKLNS
jgi:hypothetical protein